MDLSNRDNLGFTRPSLRSSDSLILDPPTTMMDLIDGKCCVTHLTHLQPLDPLYKIEVPEVK